MPRLSRTFIEHQDHAGKKLISLVQEESRNKEDIFWQQ